MLTHKGIEAIRDRFIKATPGPWRWTALSGSPQLEGSMKYADMNPILVARECGNEHGDLVQGCMPEKFNDNLRACPLHPNEEDRDFIANAYDDIQQLLEYIADLERKVNGTTTSASHKR